jgi:phosphoglycerate dehydrogenase-like enzyme
LLKPGAILINAARGPITDTSAFLWAVENDRVGGLALDSFEGEHLWIKEAELVHDRANFSPQEYRLAFESFYRILNTNLETILAFAQKGEICHSVT